ncbi:MAG: bifunctional (p)ppGpp synthetase/guanosine-3',5'-bis(diphosphate) 3'-pyrophosphohydrolase [Pseudomonadota bacterium]|nr:bifunctional (p)ppGpp synthetase/guanosine-3',5'-bis(diphosphate) 3'-pyrophosphohydrolase [Pseudomonadota bacterium]
MLRQYELVEKVRAYDPDADEGMLNRAYVFSMKAHGTQVRANGDPYFSHPIEVAGILTDLKLDDETIVTAILHDTIEDTLATAEEIERLFGANVARLVDGVTKLSKIEAQSENERAAENLRKFLLALSDDIRVLLVKLADRLHNMRTLHHIPAEEKRRRIARETMDIYAPLAERIGMYEMMQEMQQLAFKELEPDAYASITRRLAQLHASGGDLVNRIGLGLQLHLADNSLEAEVTGREKHPFSIWKKMAERHISFEQLSDVMAFRVIVDDIAECYRAMGLIHQRWPMVPGRFKDYISTPKRNGYRSLHTSVIHDAKMRIEIQIRTRQMHEQAERGLAAHWAYKEGRPADELRVPWIDDLVEILDHAASPEELLEHTRMAMYQDRIFAFTPKGELIQLPKGGTPIDFAYAVHTDLGDRTVGAKVNGRVVPLRTILDNGDQVEILASEAQHPQPSWLRFVVTGKARAGVRRFVRHKERDETIELGRKIYEEIVERLPAELDKDAIKHALKRLEVETEDELMIAIARKRASDAAVMEALMPGSAGGDVAPRPMGQRTAISIKGLTAGVAYHLAGCCHPVPGDRIVGLRREDEEIEVHVIGCDTLASGVDADWLDLSWGEGSDGGAARIAVILRDIPGALGTMSGILGAKHANIVNLQLVHRDGNFHTFNLDVEVHDLAHLHAIIAALRDADPISSVERI